MKLLFAPHNDDETLFASFTMMRESPLLVVVFDGHLQGMRRGVKITAQQRRAETLAAVNELGCAPPLFMGFSDAAPPSSALSDAIGELIRKTSPEAVWAPAVEPGGHEQHNAVGRIARELFPGTRHYLTYTRPAGKSVHGTPVAIGPGMIERKLRALACYESQIELENCREHFLRGLHEYYA